MLTNEYVQHQQWRDREAEWNRKAERGDFAHPERKPKPSAFRKWASAHKPGSKKAEISANHCQTKRGALN
ncbi:hypothetical protein ACFQZE_04120 [Paenibacillus sp. GCM10027627]|uniref:hypothetical protein n=1 Tax=unclassified Paenibacillus TaxID=185978 RepID=UPI00363FC868